MTRLFTLCIALLVFGSCAHKEQSLSDKYPRKPNETSERKSGRAMLFYEQAEKDMDVNNSVIVVEPPAADVQSSSPAVSD